MRKNSQVTIVYNYIQKEKGITGEEIAHKAGLPKKIVSCYISKLIREKLIKHEGSQIYNNRKRKSFVINTRYRVKQQPLNKADNFDSFVDTLLVVGYTLLDAFKALRRKNVKIDKM
jgi:hypothetical protein